MIVEVLRGWFVGDTGWPARIGWSSGDTGEHRRVGHGAVGNPVVARPRRSVVGILVGHGVIRPHRRAGTVAQVDERLEIVRTYLASFTTGDPDAVAACVTAEFVNEHLSELGSGCVGRDEYRRRLPGFLSTFAEARYSVVTLAGIDTPDAGDVVVRYRFQAIHDGLPIDIPGVMWFEVRDGLISRRTDLWDSLTFLRQTGRAV